MQKQNRVLPRTAVEKHEIVYDRIPSGWRTFVVRCSCGLEATNVDQQRAHRNLAKYHRN